MSTSLTASLGRRLPGLRAALGLDALVTGTNGVAYLAAAGPLSDLLGLSPGLLRGAGAFLVGFAALVAVLAHRRAPARPAVLAVVAVNALWAADSLAAAAAGWGSPTGVGTAWIVLQAATVAGFAALQVAALRAR
jgi:hypothetical protein